MTTLCHSAKFVLIGRLGLPLFLIAIVSAFPFDRVSAGDRTERVRGYFCKTKADQIAFLMHRSRGENAVMAANAVNKSIADASCANFLPLTAIPGSEQTVMENGLVFKVQKFVFLPEKAEYWTGSVFGSLGPSAEEQNI